ncbi:MAG TPA: flagellar hook-associated protein FlgL [Vicinamibacterales bacterium]|nr:flagellar hook-associated protein FlgL [Vicinamibacterales bacterium]
MRVTFQTMYRDSLTNVNKAEQNLQQLQQEVSSGVRVQVPSDDPAATVVAIKEQNQLSALTQFSNSTDAATARLNVVDSVMSDMVTQIDSAKTATAGVLGSNVTATQQQAAVAQLQSVRDALVSDLNTQFQGSYVFSGSQSTTAPYTESGGTVSAYQGDSNPISVNIDQQITVPVTFNGQAIAQGTAPTDVFTDIGNLITAIQGGNTAGINTGMTNLTNAFNRVVEAQTTVGINEQTLQSQQLRLQTQQQAATTQLSQARDANMAQAISGLAQAQTAEQAALGAAATINKVSLFDYLR